MDASSILSCWREPVVGFAGGSRHLKSVQELVIENHFVRKVLKSSGVG